MKIESCCWYESIWRWCSASNAAVNYLPDRVLTIFYRQKSNFHRCREARSAAAHHPLAHNTHTPACAFYILLLTSASFEVVDGVPNLDPSESHREQRNAERIRSFNSSVCVRSRRPASQPLFRGDDPISLRLLQQPDWKPSHCVPWRIALSAHAHTHSNIAFAWAAD